MSTLAFLQRMTRPSVPIAALAALALVVSVPLRAQAEDPRRFNALLIPIDWVDEPYHLDFAHMDAHYVPWLTNFFAQISNGRLDLRVTVAGTVVRLPDVRAAYHMGCLATPCPPGHNMWEETDNPISIALELGLIQQNANGLMPLTGEAADDRFHAVLFVRPIPDGACNYPTPYGGWMTNGARVDADPSGQRYTVGYAQLEDRTATTPCYLDEDDIGAVAHELGHAIIGNSAHPAGYANAFELMDSCYPCSPGVFSRIPSSHRADGEGRWFDGWLPPSALAEFSPSSGGGTVNIAPNALNPSALTSPQGVRMATSQGYSYIMECRRRLPPDHMWPPDRDEGLLLLRVAPGTNPPTSVVQAPSYGSPWRSVWYPGESFYDSEADLLIAVNDDIGDACTASITYGPAAAIGPPDVGLTPWLTRPNDTYETVDIWIDSVCNGYEADDPSDPSRLVYGRTGGNVNGNGDPPCLFHENRLYARVRNYGLSEAKDVAVRFEVTDPLGVGIRGAAGWLDLGYAPTISSIAPGGVADVYVPWFPETDLEDVIDGRTSTFLHSCVRVVIDQVLETLPEVNMSNQDGRGEQENVDYFEIRLDRSTYAPKTASGSIRLVNEHNETRRFYLGVESDLPDGWDLAIGDDRGWLDLGPGGTASVPVEIMAPWGVVAGQSYDVRVTGYVDPVYPINLAVPRELEYVAGLVLRAVVKTEVDIGISAQYEWSGHIVRAHGCLSPPLANIGVTVDYVTLADDVLAQTVRTDSAGCFDAQIVGSFQGLTRVRAIFAGTATHSSATSNVIRVPVATTLSTCCDTSPMPACQRIDLEECVCAHDSYCCTTAWDGLCVAEVTSLGCGTCRSACSAGTDSGAYQQDLQVCVCGSDPYCCTTAWDSACVSGVGWWGCGAC